MPRAPDTAPLSVMPISTPSSHFHHAQLDLLRAGAAGRAIKPEHAYLRCLDRLARKGALRAHPTAFTGRRLPIALRKIRQKIF